ncbi:MAG: phosphotransferase [Proteobacteria bacterium]|nr:phosphotransferase [Pseudomonadota bacterium]
MNVPTDPAAFTTEWLAASLGAPRGSLRDFASKAVGTGQMSKSYRLALDWDDFQGPASVIAKCPSLDAKTRAIAQTMKCYTLELGWYRELAREAQVACPRCLHLESANDDLDFVLLLEDLAPAQAGDQLAGASIKQIETALKQAARLHAPFWGNGRADAYEWLRPNENATGMIRMLLPTLYPQFRERYAPRLSPDILEMGKAFVAKLDGYLTRAPTATTVQHRDFRIDNILFAPGDERAFIVDWQTLGMGAGASDVAYLIGTSIADPAVRAREERRFVEFYARELAELGVAADADALWREYRLYAFSGFLMAVLASMNVERTERGDEMFAVMAERPAWQILALDSLSLL